MSVLALVLAAVAALAAMVALLLPDAELTTEAGVAVCLALPVVCAAARPLPIALAVVAAGCFVVARERRGRSAEDAALDHDDVADLDLDRLPGQGGQVDTGA